MHPVSRGWKEFTLKRRALLQQLFRSRQRNGPKRYCLSDFDAAARVTEARDVAWCIERPDGGRGFGIVMPHFYKNWRHAELRRFILNGIVWTAKLDVPAEGVKTETPDLAAFQPTSVEFVPPLPKNKNKL